MLCHNYFLTPVGNRTKSLVFRKVPAGIFFNNDKYILLTCTFLQKATSSSIDKPTQQCVGLLYSTDCGFVLQVQVEVPSAAATTKQVNLKSCVFTSKCMSLALPCWDVLHVQASVEDPFAALGDTLAPAEPVAPKQPVYTGPQVKEVQRDHSMHVICVCAWSRSYVCVTVLMHVSQSVVTSEKGHKCGEREDTLPPGYRFENVVSLPHSLLLFLKFTPCSFFVHVSLINPKGTIPYNPFQTQQLNLNYLFSL